MTQRVETMPPLSYTASRLCFRNCQFRINMLQVPLKWFAVKLFFQFKSVVDAENELNDLK